ncbi:MAG: dihydroorotate dehydrogenase-like protein [Bacteroidales bacterium]
MDLSTKYAGLQLRNPLIVSSSKITGNVDKIKKCAAMGAGAIVLKSVFEEQIMDSIQEKVNKDDMYFWYPEAEEHVKSLSVGQGVQQYLNLIKEAKSAVDIPVIASVNCAGGDRWIDFAGRIEEAGADAVELNIAVVPYDENMDCNAVENSYREIVKNVAGTVNIPVIVKLGFYFSNIVKISKALQDAGAKGLVVFNRFYRPDIDTDSFEIVNHRYLSTPAELTLSLRWVGLLRGRMDIDISASTGIHSPDDAVKQLLAGATTVQFCSTLYKNGIEQILKMKEGLEKWMDGKGFDRIEDFRGKVGGNTLQKAAFERIQYIERTML